MEIRIKSTVFLLVLLINVIVGKDSQDSKGDEGNYLQCTCNSGSKKKVLACVDEKSGALHVAEKCLNSRKAEIQLTSCQNKQFCLARWHQKGWTNCTATCGGGTQKPILECRRFRSTDVVPKKAFGGNDEPCSYIAKPKERACNQIDCAPTIIHLGWSKCSRTCGEGVRYRQVDCLQKLANGTEVQSTECNIEDVQRLMEPCHSQPCDFMGSPYVIASPKVRGRRRLSRGTGGPVLPAIKVGTGNHWQPKKEIEVHAMIGDRVSAAVGTRVFIKCSFAGVPEPRATWFYGEKRIDNDRYLPYSYSYKDYVTVLEIPSLKKFYSGQYSCRIENRFGVIKASTDVRLIKAGEPTIFSERKIVDFGPNDRVVNITIGTNATLFESTKVNILCPVQAYPFRLRVRWRAVNVETTRGIRRYGYYGSDLRIQSARIGHSGTYVCTGEAYLGSDSESSTIKVIAKVAPKIQKSSAKVYGRADAYPFVNITIGDTLVAENGAQIEVVCPATGSPQPKITWYRRGVPIMFPSINMFTKKDNSILVIREMKNDASDTYSCVATNVAGQQSVGSKITVLPPGAFRPKIEGKRGTVLVTGEEDRQSVTIGQKAEVFEGKPLTVYCPAKGLPKPDISWKFEGQPIEELKGVNIMVDKSGGGLMIVQVTRKVAGSISCVAENVLGGATMSSRIELQGSSQPKIILTGNDVRVGKKAVTVSAMIGNDVKTSGDRKVRLVCPISGWPLPKVVWNKNGKSVDLPTSKMMGGVAKGSVLLIDNAQESDSGTYTCYAINPAGVAMSSSKVTVLEPNSPIITSVPMTKKFLEKTNVKVEIGTNVTSLLGNTLTIRCPFDGTDNTQVSWSVDSQQVVLSKRVYLVENNALRIENVGFFDNGVYECKVWNSEGHDTQKTLLRITAPHNQIVKASNKISRLVSYTAEEDLHVVIGHNLTVTSGHNIFITCPVRGVLRPVITWMKGNNVIKSGADVSVEGEQLLLTNVDKNDTGTYSCFARTKFGTSNSSTHLTVIVPTRPIIYKGNDDVTGDDVSKTKQITIGDRLFAVNDLTVEIKCRVSAGIPKPRITWYHNNGKIVSNGVYATVKENNDLLIPKLDGSLRGVYRCVAENMKGTDEASTNVMIMFSFPPNIIRSLNHFTDHNTPTSSEKAGSLLSIGIGDFLKASEGRNVMINCQATGIPKPRIIWTKDGNDLVSGDRITIYENGSLLVRGISEEDTGSFACVAINNRGVDTFWSDIKVLGKDRAMVAVAEQLEEKVQVNASEPTVEANIGTNITTLPGKELTLNCPSIGKPKPKVTWYKDAVELEPTSQIRLGEAGELVFKEVSYEDAARYTCVAENEYGRDKMSSILNVATLPEQLIVSPEKPESSDLRPPTVSKKVKLDIGMFGDILSGKTVHIECPTKGSVKPKITWLLEEEEIKPSKIYGINDNVLTIRNQKAGDYIYTCRAETFLGSSEMQSNVRFIDPAEPKIHSTKKDKIITDEKIKIDIGGNIKIKFGSQLDIKCPYFGVPTPNVKWFKGGRQVTDRDNVVIKGSGSVLRIPFVKMDDNTSYACEASNGVGKKALETMFVGVFKPESAAIKVKPAEKEAALTYPKDEYFPTIIKEENKTGSIGQNYSILAGMQLLLNCPVSGDPKPEIVWKKDNEPIAENVETLVLDSATVENSGIYVCEATNAFGTQMMESKVSVMEQREPEIQRDPAKKDSKTEIITAISGKGSVDIDIGDDLKTFIGTEITINCPAIGIPAPTVSFYKDGAQIEPNEDIEFDLKRGTLTIKKPTAEDHGLYSCVAQNSAGVSNISSVVELIEPVAPHMSEEVPASSYNFNILKSKGVLKASVGSANVSSFPGTEVFIDCPVSGFPPPEVVWSKDGKPLNPEYDPIEIRGNGTLVLPHLTSEMQGTYVCLAVNMGGGYARNITIKVTDPVAPMIEKSSGLLDESQKLQASIAIGEDAVVLEGSEVTINCPHKAQPESTIIWSGPNDYSMDSDAFEVLNEGSTLKISRVDSSFNGLFKCIASNVFGSDHATTRLSVAESLKPMITPVMENITASMGKDEVGIVIGGHLEAPAGVLVKIACPVSGVPRPNVKWLFNGRLVHQIKMQSDSEAATYVISKLTLKDTGMFTCIAENVIGRQEASTYISVGLVPNIQSLAKNEISALAEDSVTIPVGARSVVKTTTNVVLQCFAHGIPMPLVKWYKDGDLIDVDRRYTSVINGMLEIRSVTALDDGTFTCVAKNKFGTKKAKATLIVVDPPRIVGSRGNRTEIKSKSNLIEAIVGETITVLRGVQLIARCPVKGIPTPSIQWKRLNAYHNIDPRVSITADQSLRIHDVSSFDAGTYVCIATNKAGQDTAQVHVRVAEPPSAKLSTNYRARAPSVDSTNRIVVSRNKSVTIICTVQGTPLPLIRWFKEGVEIKVDGAKYHSEGDELFINGVTMKDAGTYRCVAENMAGKNSATFNLIVGDAPQIVKGKGIVLKHSATTLKAIVGQSIYVRHHSVLMIFCQVKGTPSPVVSWNKNGKEVDRSLMVEENKILLLKDVSYSDAGNYTCMVESDLGSDQATSELVVVEPPAVKSLETKDLGHHDGLVNILLDPAKMKTVDVIQGETVKLMCVAEGYPMPKIEWLKNMHKIKSGAGDVSLSEKRSIVNKGNKVVGRVYAALKMKVSNSVYTVGCKVQNPSGKSIAQVKLHHHIPPKSPYTGVWVTKDLESCDGECVRPFYAMGSLQMQCITFGGKEVPAENCDPKAMPAKMKECKTKRCATNWKVGPWGACSSTCGNSGFRKRVVKCIFMSGSKITKDEHCRHITKRTPRRSEPCNRIRCVKHVCKDVYKYCGLVESQGYCKLEWAKRSCCITCGSKFEK